MYKLENDVEWTDELKAAFKHNVTRAKIICEGNEINYDNGLVNIELEDNRYVPNLGFIGQATAKKVTLNLLDSEQATNLENKEFTLYIGADYAGETYYINYGNYIVNASPENDSTNGNIKVVAYDYMIKFNPIWENNTTYPCTLKKYLQDVCLQAGVELGTEHFANEGFIVENNQFENKTLREILQNIAKCAFSWARIGQDNKLYLDFEIEGDVSETITINDYLQDKYKKANEYYGPINKVTYGQSDIKGQEESVLDQESIQEYGLNELVINDNYFAYTNAKRYELIQEGTRLLGLRYMPIQELETIGLIYLDCNDLIEIQDEEENSIITRVLSHTIRYNGATNDLIQAEGQSLNEQTYKNQNSTAVQSSKTEIMVDRANKLITSTVETVEAQNTKISRVEQTVDELNSKISEIADITVSQETLTGRLNFTDINESEPIHIEIRPTGENISCLHPLNTLFPANNLYIRLRNIRFTNITTNEVFDYELPDDLLYYDNEHYDEFILDYDSHTVYINKKCKYNTTTGAVELLAQERIDEYSFPSILLTAGDYRVEILKYTNTPYGCYFFVRLMAQNIYTSQFATKAELTSEINQTATSITLSVDQKLSNYSTTSQMNSTITIKANEISSVVSTKVGKNEVISSINQSSESVVIRANKISLAGKTIDLTSDSIQINSNNFKVDTNGNIRCTNATISGNITATTGKIAGYTIDGNVLKGSSVGLSGRSGEDWAFWAGSNNSGSAPFRVGHDGSLIATNATISGTITATSGTFRNCTITNSCSVPASTVSGTLATSTIPNISASKITSGTMSGDRIIGGTMSGVDMDAGRITASGTIKGETVEGTSYVSVRLCDANYGYGYTIGGYSGQYFDLIVNDGEKGWRRLRFRGGILSEVNSSW